MRVADRSPAGGGLFAQGGVAVKVHRLLSIVMHLLTHKRIGAQELADLFEVSLRTIYRDLETIDAAGIPVVSCGRAVRANRPVPPAEPGCGKDGRRTQRRLHAAFRFPCGDNRNRLP